MTSSSTHSSDFVSVASQNSVAGTIDALQAAVEAAGAKVFARVDHAGGAQKVGADLAPAELLIFGNPKLGTPAMQSDIRAGLFLPLKALAYQNADGQVFLTYQDPAKMLAGLDIAADAPFVGAMQGALAKLSAAATS